jgi:hypothetical protein
MGSLWSLTKYSVNMAGDLFVDKKLSFVAVLAFLLSGIFHRPLGKSWWRRVHTIVEQYRDPNSHVLFLRNFFVLDRTTNNWSISHIFDVHALKALYYPKFNSVNIEVTVPLDVQQQQDQVGLIPSFIYNTTSPGYFISLDIPATCAFVDQKNFFFLRLYSLIRLEGFSLCSAGYTVEIIMQQLVNLFGNFGTYLKVPGLSLDELLAKGRFIFQSEDKLKEILDVSIFLQQIT